MKEKHRPYIKLYRSKSEVLFVIINIFIIAIGIIYFSSNWNHIPEIILTKGGRSGDMSKFQFFLGYLGFSFQLLIFLIFCFVDRYTINSFCWVRSVSRNSQKAKNQYRVEISCFLFISVVLNLFYLFGAILQIENQLKHISISNNILLVFPIVIGITWLIHHILWTRLADK
jgi:hypothetical protein